MFNSILEHVPTMQDFQRRRFIKGVGTATIGALAGATLPLAHRKRYGLIPGASANEAMPIEGKDGLRVLNDRPLNAETLPHLLDDEVTPTERHFIRNNGIVPQDMNPDTWMLKIEGLVERPMSLSINELRNRFEVVSHRLVIECGGNGRARFDPPARGNQWTFGAVACAEWTGVRMVDVLEAAGIKDTAIYTAHEGADLHLSGTPGKLPISRGVPLAKALDPYNLIAFEMNGGPLHPMNGAPLRLVIPGRPGSCSQKWLTRIWLRNIVHDGPKMGGSSYRVPPYPVAPGEMVPAKYMQIIHALPVKSLITRPQTGQLIKGRNLEVAGHAWAGDSEVSRVDVSMDYGATWQPADLAKQHNPHAWQRFSTHIQFPNPGYYKVWARATDRDGLSQPFTAAWNPKGYLNNALHYISVRAI